jgi:hypothetical protein
MPSFIKTGGGAVRSVTNSVNKVSGGKSLTAFARRVLTRNNWLFERCNSWAHSSAVESSQHTVAGMFRRMITSFNILLPSF